VAAPDQVGIVERTLAAFGRRDLEALLGEVDPVIDVRPAVVGGLEGTVYRGHAGLRDFVADVDAAWREFRVETEEFRDLGDTVLVLGRTLARGTESGVSLDTASAYVFGSATAKCKPLGPSQAGRLGWQRSGCPNSGQAAASRSMKLLPRMEGSTFLAGHLAPPVTGPREPIRLV